MPQASSLFDELTTSTIQKVKKTGIPYIVHTEARQHGHTFGTRFGNSIKSVFSLGYDGLIVVGNDTPHLTEVQLKTAYKNLLDDKTTIGPSADGGFYLLGISKTAFQEIGDSSTSKNAFLNLPWNKDTLYSSLVALIASCNRKITSLKNLIDIDTIADGIEILGKEESLDDIIFILLRDIVYNVYLKATFSEVPYVFSKPNTSYNKGSPEPKFAY